MKWLVVDEVMAETTWRWIGEVVEARCLGVGAAGGSTASP